LYKYPVETWNGGKIHRITDRILHLMRGEIFDIPLREIKDESGVSSAKDQKIKFLAFGGAKSVDRGYDTGYNKYWWQAELPTQEEKQNALDNLEKCGNKVDYIVTHDAPYSVLVNVLLDLKPLADPKFNKFLELLNKRITFKGWFFGHHHYDRSYDKYHCLYNTIKEIKLNAAEY
jgi:hypothetical protein